MKKVTAYLYTIFAAALILAALSVSVAAQDKDKEPQKPSSSTVDAWRQALPPEAESEPPAEDSAAVKSQRDSREEAEKTLMALERKWMDALQQRDASALSQLISDDFTLVSPRLLVAAGDREKYFQNAMRELNLTSYNFEGVTVRLYGRAAVVSGRLTQSANVAGEDWGGKFLFTDVWVNRDGTWKVVSRHASPLPTDKR